MAPGQRVAIPGLDPRGARAFAPRRHGLVQDERSYPGMVLAPMPDVPYPPPGITLRDVTDQRSLEEHRGILVASGADASVVRRLLPEAFLTDPDVALTTVLLDG